jgi:fimbrial chaperone protein
MALGLALAAQPVRGGSLKVAPIRVSFDTSDNVQVMRIENSGSETTRVQLRLFDWSQKDGQDDLAPTRDVLVNPTMFEIAPGKAQLARIGLRVPVGAVEKSYRLLVDEIPSDAAPKAGEVRSLLRISIPVFVPVEKASAQLSWRAWPEGPSSLALALENTGGAHVQIRNIAMFAGHNGPMLGSHNQMLYLLPAAKRQIVVPLTGPVRPGQALEIRMATDGSDSVAALRVEGAAGAENRN